MAIKNVNGYTNIHEKFKAKEFKITEFGCWELPTSKRECYGRIEFNGKPSPIHRISYEVYKGKIGLGKIICHKCNNKKCFNPDHLYEGTRQDNARDVTEYLKNKYPFGRPKKNLNS